MDRKGIIKGYTAALEARGCKESTIKTRMWQINRLLDRLKALGLTTDPRHIGEREIRAVAGADGLKESTARNYVNMLTDLCGVYGNTSPKAVRILWNRTEAEVTWITADDLRRLLKIAPPTERIILVLGAMAGMRAGEMAVLRLSDLHRDTVTITGKGHGKGKVVDQPIPPMVREELDRYLAWRSRQGVRSDRVIVWPMGRAYEGPSARVILHARLRDLGRNLGIDVTPHSLRRLYATTLVENGVDIATVSRLMRHSSTEVTLRYIRRDRAKEYDCISTLAEVLAG